MHQFSLENIAQVKQCNTYFGLLFNAGYWIHFCVEDAKKTPELLTFK